MTLRDELDAPGLIEFWEGFNIDTLARINLSFLPLVEMLDRNRVRFDTVASFGSGSCTHEVALALLTGAHVHCYDASAEYIPARTAGYIDRLPQIIFELYDFTRPLDSTAGLVFSIQTLEHIEDYQAALDGLVRGVAAGGYLYVDTPVFHEEPEREPDIDSHRERAWRNNRHHHLGFSRQRMADRITERGLAVVDSGYYSYKGGDHALMRYIREAQKGIPATGTTIRALNRGLWTALTGSERAYAHMKDAIDSLTLDRRVCYAYRILARRPG